MHPPQVWFFLLKNMKTIRDNNYFQVDGWMINRLKLSGNELFVYAIIYGFSQDGNTKFTGSLNYLVAFVNSTKPTIIKCLKSLTEKGFIIKTNRFINNQNFPTYEVVIFDFTGGKEILPPLKENVVLEGKETLPPGKETLPNNNNYNNNNISKEIEGTPAPVSFKDKSFKQWDKSEFRKTIEEARDARKENDKLPNFDAGMLRQFYTYWSEPDAKQKMKFQKQDTWATANRLATWQDRDLNKKN